MRNLARINNYANRIQAIADWRQLKACAAGRGYADVAARLEPPENASWRKIDKQIAELRRIMETEAAE